MRACGMSANGGQGEHRRYSVRGRERPPSLALLVVNSIPANAESCMELPGAWRASGNVVKPCVASDAVASDTTRYAPLLSFKGGKKKKV